MLNSDLDRDVTICTQKNPSGFDFLSRFLIVYHSRFFYHCIVNRLSYIMQEKSQVIHDSFDPKMMTQIQAVRMAKFMNSFTSSWLQRNTNLLKSDLDFTNFYFKVFKGFQKDSKEISPASLNILTHQSFYKLNYH